MDDKRVPLEYRFGFQKQIFNRGVEYERRRILNILKDLKADSASAHVVSKLLELEKKINDG